MGRTRPKCMGWADQAHLHGLGSGPAHLSWLLCMSTITSFTSPAGVHRAHPAWRGKKRKQKKKGAVFTWRGGDSGDF